MKSIKNKLIASVAMLVVATVMMTSASFAWFTVSTAPEVQSINVSMSAVKNLEIAQAGATIATKPANEPALGDTGKDTTWGGTVSSFGTTDLTFVATLNDTSKKLSTPEYGEDGRMEAGLVDFTIKTDNYAPGGGDGKTKYCVGEVTPGGDAGTRVAAIAFPIWLRSNLGALTNVEMKWELSSTTDDNENDTNVKVVLMDKNSTVVGTAKTGATNTFDGISIAEGGTQFFIAAYVEGKDMNAKAAVTAVKANNIKITFSSASVPQPTVTP